jgi:hypothetical protein
MSYFSETNKKIDLWPDHGFSLFLCSSYSPIGKAEAGPTHINVMKNPP